MQTDILDSLGLSMLQLKSVERQKKLRNGQRNKPHVIVFNDRLFVFSLSLPVSLSLPHSTPTMCVCVSVCHPGTQVVNVSPVGATSI